MGATQDDYIKGIWSLGNLGPNPGRIYLDSAVLMLHSYQMEMLSLTFQMIQSGKYYLIFFNEHRNKEYLNWNFLTNLPLSHICIGSDPLL